MNKTTNATTQTANPFTLLLQEYEKQASNRQNEQAYTKALTDLATAVAYSVLKKCIDVSQNKALIQVRQSIASDKNTLERIAYASVNAHETTYNADGERKQIVKDKRLAEALDKLCSQTMGEGIDLVNDAVIAILNETSKQLERDPEKAVDLERAYTVRRLKRKVWIKTADSVNGWETVETTPIQEVYKAVRRSIDSSRAAQADPRNGYTYIEDVATDPESGIDEIIFRRFGKYADIGGAVTDFNGKEVAYTADEQTAEDMDTLVESLNLSKQQAEILKLRLSGYGYKAIATYFGVRQDSITKQIKRMREKAIDNGLRPVTI